MDRDGDAEGERGFYDFYDFYGVMPMTCLHGLSRMDIEKNEVLEDFLLKIHQRPENFRLIRLQTKHSSLATILYAWLTLHNVFFLLP